MLHQQNCQVVIPSSDLSLTIFTVSYHILWMGVRIAIFTDTSTDTTVEASLLLLMVGMLKAEGGGWR